MAYQLAATVLGSGKEGDGACRSLLYLLAAHQRALPLVLRFVDDDLLASGACARDRAVAGAGTVWVAMGTASDADAAAIARNVRGARPQDQTGPCLPRPAWRRA